ncbi:Site-specific tyrosine recombinase XerC [hydrothermal vent metagenome]|uniref:Site-specific tyrosine recombinase XerC n=1 Tax=hydrothermal vent metagenome TaxID=652676 RepID=A0A3B0WQP8_9ZZZZ
MALKRKGQNYYKRPKVPVEHTEFYPYLLKHLEVLEVRGYSKQTTNRRENSLRRFIFWCDERSLTHPNQITKPILEHYQRYLYYYRQEYNDKSLSASTQNQYLINIKLFFKWLTQENYLLYNPASELVIIKPVTSLPVVLSQEEIDKLLAQPDTQKTEGIRDRAILELFYSTGIRRMEMCNLQRRHIYYVTPWLPICWRTVQTCDTSRRC